MSASLMDDIGHRYKKVLLDSELDASPERQARLTSMQELYVDRDNGLDGHAAVLAPMFDDLRNAVAKKRLGPTATRFATELLAVVDLERGIYEGRPVDVAAIDQIYAAKNERELEVFAQRLPNVTLRDEARRRIIRLHIAASPFAEVRAAAAAVEETLMQKGFNAVSLAEHAAARAFLRARERRQARRPRPAKRPRPDGTLLGVKLDGGPVSVVPDVSLRGTFFAEVGGISRPITVCAPPKQLDPSPCIATGDIRSQQRVAYVDGDGALRFTDRLTMKDALDLAAGGPTLPCRSRLGPRSSPSRGRSRSSDPRMILQRPVERSQRPRDWRPRRSAQPEADHLPRARSGNRRTPPSSRRSTPTTSTSRARARTASPEAPEARAQRACRARCARAAATAEAAAPAATAGAAGTAAPSTSTSRAAARPAPTPSPSSRERSSAAAAGAVPAAPAVAAAPAAPAAPPARAPRRPTPTARRRPPPAAPPARPEAQAPTAPPASRVRPASPAT